MTLPDFSIEKPLWKKDITVIGIDEVGRGCLAGPIYVGASSFSPQITTKDIELLGINDSKKLSIKKRETLYNILPTKQGFSYSVGVADASYINRFGIVQALNHAVIRALDTLMLTLNTSSIHILYDGSINHTHSSIDRDNTTTITKGDSLSTTIASASIMAKVARDHYMEKLALKFPKYLWENNKGYGTQAHCEAIKTYGTSSHHRSLYLRKILGTLEENHDI